MCLGRTCHEVLRVCCAMSCRTLYYQCYTSRAEGMSLSDVCREIGEGTMVENQSVALH